MWNMFKVNNKDTRMMLILQNYKHVSKKKTVEKKRLNTNVARKMTTKIS